MKKILIMLILFFICGFVSADLCVEELKESNVILETEIYESYANAGFSFKDIFWNILYERLKLLFLVILLFFTPLREKLSVILLSLFSFIWGYFFLSCIVQLGIVGLVVAIAAVFPHGLLYAAVAVFLLQKGYHRYYHPGRTMLMGVGKYLVLFLMFLTGCVVEGLVATHFVPWVIRLSFI